jgi:hypothetical protein
VIGTVIGWISQLLGISSLIARYFQKQADVQQGRTEQTVADQAAVIHETQEANEAAVSVKSMSDSQLDDELRRPGGGS